MINNDKLLLGSRPTPSSGVWHVEDSTRVLWIPLTLLAVASWSALGYLIGTYPATTGAVLVFFPLWFLGVFSLALLLLWLLYGRMPRWYRAHRGP
ncbi:MAG: hypothetical protein HZY76_22350 [Anaerolineae bacterium]|nr:MAG: hypothetical protein HZY76_22350 [Anaerolineae bacterium]